MYVVGPTDQLGIQSSTKFITTPLLMNYTFKVKQVVCSSSMTYILSQEGDCYFDNQKILSNVKQLALGASNLLALLNDGNVAHYEEQTKKTMTVQGLPKITQIACGGQFAFFLSATNDMYSIGQNQKGQLGIDSNMTHAHNPLKVELAQSQRVTQISCGFEHCLIKTIDNKVFACGSNDEGQLGLGLSNKSASRFVEVVFLSTKKIIQIAAGQASYAVSVSGELYVWGKYQQKVIWQPIKIMEEVRSISQSFYGLTAAIDRTNCLWLWQNLSSFYKTQVSIEPAKQKGIYVSDVWVSGFSLFAVKSTQIQSSRASIELRETTSTQRTQQSSLQSCKQQSSVKQESKVKKVKKQPSKSQLRSAIKTFLQKGGSSCIISRPPKAKVVIQPFASTQRCNLATKLPSQLPKNQPPVLTAKPQIPIMQQFEQELKSLQQELYTQSSRLTPAAPMVHIPNATVHQPARHKSFLFSSIKHLMEPSQPRPQPKQDKENVEDYYKTLKSEFVNQQKQQKTRQAMHSHSQHMLRKFSQITMDPYIYEPVRLSARPSSSVTKRQSSISLMSNNQQVVRHTKSLDSRTFDLQQRIR